MWDGGFSGRFFRDAVSCNADGVCRNNLLIITNKQYSVQFHTQRRSSRACRGRRRSIYTADAVFDIIFASAKISIYLLRRRKFDIAASGKEKAPFGFRQTGFLNAECCILNAINTFRPCRPCREQLLRVRDFLPSCLPLPPRW